MKNKNTLAAYRFIKNSRVADRRVTRPALSQVVIPGGITSISEYNHHPSIYPFRTFNFSTIPLIKTGLATQRFHSGTQTMLLKLATLLEILLAISRAYLDKYIKRIRFGMRARESWRSHSDTILDLDPEFCHNVLGSCRSSKEESYAYKLGYDPKGATYLTEESLYIVCPEYNRKTQCLVEAAIDLLQERSDLQKTKRVGFGKSRVSNYCQTQAVEESSRPNLTHPKRIFMIFSPGAVARSLTVNPYTQVILSSSGSDIPFMALGQPSGGISNFTLIWLTAITAIQKIGQIPQTRQGYGYQGNTAAFCSSDSCEHSFMKVRTISLNGETT
ncbi:uncharacterized protein BDR25DRAFT_353265 [Lindgomyces ingoldianus]|uniref:Uncharacterized protein n=1 Tax=Lindgomyces ingoldianus TaxID=673940 RepID=A0ACB6R3E2_9PLEO|nr:uncharacterized protein BDR25DRAFT_353265 [Lindgomyces ingoldianus]KAF2472956.1 hypothetical protein BDR25DRAFT_353265 [Lindgomyces ingoldianus]